MPVPINTTHWDRRRHARLCTAADWAELRMRTVRGRLCPHLCAAAWGSVRTRAQVHWPAMACRWQARRATTQHPHERWARAVEQARAQAQCGSNTAKLRPSFACRRPTDPRSRHSACSGSCSSASSRPARAGICCSRPGPASSPPRTRCVPSADGTAGQVAAQRHAPCACLCAACSTQVQLIMVTKPASPNDNESTIAGATRGARTSVTWCGEHVTSALLFCPSRL